jgi:hypothetical protein
MWKLTTCATILVVLNNVFRQFMTQVMCQVLWQVMWQVMRHINCHVMWHILWRVITSDARYFIVDLVMSILRLHIYSYFSPSKLISFTKLRFRQSFWGAQHVKILIGSKAMTKNTKGFISVFLPFFKTKSWKFMSHKWPF